MTAARPAPGRAPSALLPLSYLVAASAALLLAAAGTVWLAPELAGHYYHPRVVALTHTVTLGWITLTIFGASYQLVPVVLERPLWSERLARWQFAVLALGVTGMVAHFYLATWPGLGLAALVAGVGITAHLVNLTLTLRGFTRWTFTARLIVLAHAGLALTVLFGLGLAADRLWKILPGDFFPTLHAHFHLALLGWVAPMVMGVAARVYPMFLVAREPEGWPGALQFWGLAAGVPLLVAGLLGATWLLAPGVVAVAAAIAGHVGWISRMAGDRQRPTLDWGLRLALTGAAFLPVAGLTGAGLGLGLLQGPRTSLAYAVLALGGWVSLTIIGMLLKIVPFLVWYRVYAPQAGRVRVPTLGQLGWPGAEAVAYGLLVPGMALLAGAAWLGSPAAIAAAGLVVALGAGAFALSLLRVLAHLVPARSRRPAPGTLTTSLL